ncbi:MAG: hypothetical protein ACXU9C_31445 [Xanthobacteraceae bacterium]
MNDTGSENKARNREIARNERVRQTVGDIRVSSWAIAVAVIIGLAAVGWVLIHNR